MSAPAAQGAHPARRLAAVAFVDVVGYSILMGRDEQRTHTRWMTILNDVLRPLAAQHRGRVVKSTGDGVLAEFPSALDAVEWGQELQAASAANNKAAEEDAASGPAIVLRIGMHLGDVIETADDIYGDGVNVAARLQEHAEPGGIVLSEAMHGLVQGSLQLSARDIGLVTLKNFDRPVHAYAIEPPSGRPTVPAAPTLGPLPSIAVLPFRNLGGDSADDYFGEGLVEDIIVSLSSLRELRVIARTSTVAYLHQEPDVRQVGRALGVRYVMTGSVRRSPRGMRSSVHLSDATTGASLWDYSAEVPLGDLFEVQDEIVRRIAAGIAPQVRSEELRRTMRKRPESFTAYDHMLRALHVMNKLDAATFGKAIELLERAMAEDPGFSMPPAWAARWHSIRIGQGWSPDVAEDARQALALAARAIDLDRTNALALATYGHLQSRLFRDFDTALLYFDRALTACPNSSVAWSLSALTLAYIGQADRAVQHAEHGLRLSPLDSAIYFHYTNLGCAYYAAGKYEDAAKWLKMAANENPIFTANLRLLCAALAALDRRDEAASVAERHMRLEPNFKVTEYAHTRQPFRDPELTHRFLDHLRSAGLSE